ncbi:MAG: hypothetical protein ACI9OD_004265 [Limisphaerales bacterium]|jgi:hypothetical protein
MDFTAGGVTPWALNSGSELPRANAGPEESARAGKAIGARAANANSIDPQNNFEFALFTGYDIRLGRFVLKGRYQCHNFIVDCNGFF